VGCGGSVGGGLVGGGLVGTIGAGVEVGGDVRIGNGEDVVVGRASIVLGVNVGINVRVAVGVRVTVGVAVGMIGVRVGVSEAVGVGAVDVGKGPRSEPAVSASAVFVLFTCCWAAASRGARLNATM
jgi:hypothetical protein